MDCPDCCCWIDGDACDCCGYDLKKLAVAIDRYREYEQEMVQTTGGYPAVVQAVKVGPVVVVSSANENGKPQLDVYSWPDFLDAVDDL